MSWSIKTLNLGDIEPCGFTLKSTALIRLGKYEIPTLQFADFAAYVLGGGKEGWKEIPQYVKKAVDTITPCVKDADKNIEYKLAKCRICEYKPSITERVKIGDYEIGTPEFAWFAVYILTGGICGWKETPWYVTKAMQEIDRKIMAK